MKIKLHPTLYGDIWLRLYFKMLSLTSVIVENNTKAMVGKFVLWRKLGGDRISP